MGRITTGHGARTSHKDRARSCAARNHGRWNRDDLEGLAIPMAPSRRTAVRADCGPDEDDVVHSAETPDLRIVRRNRTKNVDGYLARRARTSVGIGRGRSNDYTTLYGARPSVNSMYVPYGSVRNATFTLLFGTWRMGASIFMPLAARPATNASRSLTSKPM
jgi:hypothetical protein